MTLSVTALMIMGGISMLLFGLNWVLWLKLMAIEWGMPVLKSFAESAPWLCWRLVGWVLAVVSSLLSLPVFTWIGVDMKEFNSSDSHFTWNEMTNYHHWTIWLSAVVAAILIIGNLGKEVSFRLQRSQGG
jgi:hypothetical protein